MLFMICHVYGVYMHHCMIKTRHFWNIFHLDCLKYLNIFRVTISLFTPFENYCTFFPFSWLVIWCNFLTFLVQRALKASIIQQICNQPFGQQIVVPVHFVLNLSLSLQLMWKKNILATKSLHHPSHTNLSNYQQPTSSWRFNYFKYFSQQSFNLYQR